MNFHLPAFWRQTFPSSQLDTALQRENNNFDLLRGLAATAVIVGHSYAISPRSGFIDPIQRLISFDYSGDLAVLLFFFLSGALVTDSYRRNPDTLHFILARITRIFPGLAMCLFLSITVAGPVFTTFSLGNYFGSPETASYYFNNLCLTNLQWHLPGVFAQSKYGLNGSLWTLPTEVRLYAIIALLGLLPFLSSRWLASLILAGGICTLGFGQEPIPFLTQSHELRLLSTAFAIGAFCAVNKHRVPLNGLITLVFWGITAACWNVPARDVLFYGAFVYTCIFLFQLPLVRRWRLPGDYSYGIYIYGFLIQQCVNGAFPGSTPWFNAVVSIPICILLGSASWHFIEKPCLVWAKEIRLPDWNQFSASLDSFVRKGGAVVVMLIVITLVPLGLSLAAKEGPTGSIDLSDLVIQSFGPNNVKAGEVFNRQSDGRAALWVKTSRPLNPEAQLFLGGNPLVSSVSGDVITALVPAGLFAKASTLPLRIREPSPEGYRYSKPVDWNVLP